MAKKNQAKKKEVQLSLIEDQANLGRPKGEGSIVIRVPMGCADRVKSIVDLYRFQQKKQALEDQLNALNRELDDRLRGRDLG